MKPQKHAENSARKYGGQTADYLDIHNFMDSSKAHVPDHRHRAIFHSSFGCFIVEQVFGVTRKNSEGQEYSTRDVAEQHILEDLGTIPTVQDWLSRMPLEKWMGGGNSPEQPLVLAASNPMEVYKAAKEKAAAGFRQALAARLAKVFEVHPEYTELTWTQYVPSFNDGSPCTFTLGELRARTAGSVEDDEDDLKWVHDSGLEDFDETFFEREFGNGNRITVTRGLEFKVTDYDCGY